MKLERIIFMVALAFASTGCDKVEQIGSILADEPVTLVFAPGFEIVIEHKPVVIYGRDKCPKREVAMVKIFGSAPTDGLESCVVLTPYSKNVSVGVGLPSGNVTEEWMIIREKGKTKSGRAYSRVTLQRPDGSLVVPFTHSNG